MKMKFLFIIFLLIFLISCSEKQTTTITQSVLTYELTKLKINDEDYDVKEMYEYYLVTFDNNEGNVILNYKRIVDEEEIKVYGKYVKGETFYLATIDGLDVKFDILDNGKKVSSEIFYTYSIYELKN